MKARPETLSRLCAPYFPGGTPSAEWLAGLATLLDEHEIEDIEVAAYGHAVSLRRLGERGREETLRGDVLEGRREWHMYESLQSDPLAALAKALSGQGVA